MTQKDENGFDQELLNKPITDKNGLSDENRSFLDLLKNLVSEKKIDLYKPSTLINFDVYNGLPSETKAKIDYEVVNLMSSVRNLLDLDTNGFGDSFQSNLQIAGIRETKNRIENVKGDVFII